MVKYIGTLNQNPMRLECGKQTYGLKWITNFLQLPTQGQLGSDYAEELELFAKA